jgi:NAD(P)-dependent dehydrogenase (short-subunit alcohol dehydrogenase family)
VELTKGQVAVVTGAGSGIGLALAERFAAAGLNVVLADVQEDALAAAAVTVGTRGVEVLAVRTDVSKEADVQALAAATIERFGAVHVVCNNAGVASGSGDPWSGPLASWEWVLGVNLWGIVHGCRAFLPHLLGGGYIVNTASVAGLHPGFSPAYDASKHAAVAITEDLYNTMQAAGLPVGVSVLCPGWVRTNIHEAERNFPGETATGPDPVGEVMRGHVARVIAEGMPPAQVADAVYDAIASDTFWVIPTQQEFLDIITQRWSTIPERINPTAIEIPGLPPRDQIVAEVMAALEAAGGQS